MSTTVFIANLPFDYNDRKVREYFYFSGTIRKFELVKNEQGSSYGVAFVRLKDRTEAERFVKKHDKTLVEGRMISVKIADHDL